MISLNDYLYNGDTVLKIIQKYSHDLKKSAIESGNSIDIAHCNFLLQLEEILEHNEFLTSQSQRIKEFYKYMTVQYPFLAFTFKGRIKSLIRAEQKFNGYIVEEVTDYYKETGKFPDEIEMKQRSKPHHQQKANRNQSSHTGCIRTDLIFCSLMNLLLLMELIMLVM